MVPIFLLLALTFSISAADLETVGSIPSSTLDSLGETAGGYGSAAAYDAKAGILYFSSDRGPGDGTIDYAHARRTLGRKPIHLATRYAPTALITLPLAHLWLALHLGSAPRFSIWLGLARHALGRSRSLGRNFGYMTAFGIPLHMKPSGSRKGKLFDILNAH